MTRCSYVFLGIGQHDVSPCFGSDPHPCNLGASANSEEKCLVRGAFKPQIAGTASRKDSSAFNDYTLRTPSKACADLLKTCTGPPLEKDLKDEGGRRDQMLDDQAQERAGVGDHPEQATAAGAGRAYEPSLCEGQGRVDEEVWGRRGERLVRHARGCVRQGLSQALIARFGMLDAVPEPFLL
ncbi:hypothetical protein D3C79_829300 [compost metagenome]